MKLNDIRDENSPRKNRKRVGRGIGSGKGKTCGSGHKGQKSRSGVSINGFEGGQMPIYRRVPKRGFVNIHRIAFQWVNVGDLQKFVDSKKIDSKKAITRTSLFEAGILKRADLPFKILAKGELKSSLNIEADAASASAIKIVEKSGGKLTVIDNSSKKAA